jgi:hypothetical protein
VAVLYAAEVAATAGLEQIGETGVAGCAGGCHRGRREGLVDDLGLVHYFLFLDGLEAVPGRTRRRLVHLYRQY